MLLPIALVAIAWMLSEEHRGIALLVTVTAVIAVGGLVALLEALT